MPLDNDINVKYPEPTLARVKNPNYSYNYFPSWNTNIFGNSISNNINYTQNTNNENKNYFYYNNNNFYNNIYI